MKTTGGPALAATVVIPAMTRGAVSLLQEHLTEGEKELWTSLGSNWTSSWSVCVMPLCINLVLRVSHVELTDPLSPLSPPPVRTSMWPFLHIHPSSWMDGSLGPMTPPASLWRIPSSCSTSRMFSGKGWRRKLCRTKLEEQHKAQMKCKSGDIGEKKCINVFYCRIENYIFISERAMGSHQKARDFTAAVMTLWQETAVSSLCYKEKHWR